MTSEDYPERELTGRIIGVAIDVHKEVGPGFAEKVYQRILAKALREANLYYKRENEVRIIYKGNNVGFQVIDFVIANRVIVEIKAVGQLESVHTAQVISYLKATGMKIGLVLNFGSAILGIKRVIL